MGKKRRGYLKHYNDATVGQTIQDFIIDQRYDAIGLFWLLLELQNQNEGKETKISVKHLCRIYNMKKCRIRSLLGYVGGVATQFSLNINEVEITFNYSKYAEYQDPRSTNNARKRHETSPIKDYRLKIKDKRRTSVFVGEGKEEEIIKVTQDTEASTFFDFFNGEIDELQKSYPSLLVRQEIKKVLYFYQDSTFHEMPKTKSHWINAIKKKLQTRADEVKALAEKGLKEVWDDSGANVEYHRV